MEYLNTEDAIILLYHGVTSVDFKGILNYSGKHIHKKVFEDQIGLIARTCNPVSLRTLISMLAGKEPLLPKTVAITFDDCFENIYNNAYPILKKFNVPATMFITTGFVNAKRIIWADLLEIIICNSFEKEIIFDFFSFRKKYTLNSEEEKIKALLDIKSILKSIDENTKDWIMESFSKKYEIDTISETDLYRNLTWDQAKKIDQDPLFEMGSHTINHRILTGMDLESAEKEIVGSKEMLQKELGHGVDLFSYPEGQPNHYNEHIVKILKNHGFICSPTAIYGLNRIGDNPFDLKRIMVGFNGIPFPFN